IHLFGNREFAIAMTRSETWDAINQPNPESRAAIVDRLARIPGRHLVFVRYSPRHGYDKWVYNGADIDSSRIIWARDLGPAEDQVLRRYYSNRTDWLIEPDARPPRLTPYGTESVGPSSIAKPPESHPQLKFEDVH
ncbi:MAG: hypothetical protein ACRD30_01870, partial [Bryobacteraceae bacterium]